MLPDVSFAAQLAAVFGIGLAGSVHCIGMCGGFAIALAQKPGSPRGMAQARYFAGKTLSYAALGLLAGAFGSALALVLGPLQHVIGIGFGVVLIAVGLRMAGWWGVGGAANVPGLGAAFGWALRQPPSRAAWSLGLLNGLLPCGMVYAMLAMAATTGSPLQGALVMATFGVSTLPALALAALLGRMARPMWRARLNTAAGIALLLVGGWTIVRSLPAAPSDALADPHHAERVALKGADEAMCR